MNSDTATTQWGQDEKVGLIEPDRGETAVRALSERERGERRGERTGRGEEESRLIHFSFLFSSNHSPINGSN